MGNIPDSMKKVVVDIETSFGERKRFIHDLNLQELDRQEDAEKESKERKKDLKVFVGSVQEFLTGVRDDMDEAHDIWQTLTKPSKHTKNEKKKK